MNTPGAAQIIWNFDQSRSMYANPVITRFPKTQKNDPICPAISLLEGPTNSIPINKYRKTSKIQTLIFQNNQ